MRYQILKLIEDPQETESVPLFVNARKQALEQPAVVHGADGRNCLIRAQKQDQLTIDSFRSDCPDFRLLLFDSLQSFGFDLKPESTHKPKSPEHSQGIAGKHGAGEGTDNFVL